MDKATKLSPTISLKYLIKRFFGKITLTWGLVIVEAATLVAMPMVIGHAIDNLIKESMTGIYQLGGLCIILLITGAIRRFYDTRAYAGIYTEISDEITTRENRKNSSISKLSARVHLFSEFIEFLENSIPDILHQFVGLAGTLAIIFFINIKIFIACILAIVAITLIYMLSSGKIFTLNQKGNDEIEKQVEILKTRDSRKIHNHFHNLMKWQIKLSDLETLNFSGVWLLLAAIMVFTILDITGGATTFGTTLSVVMYVFNFIESVLGFPFHYQQMIRLKEISYRLSSEEERDKIVS